MVLCKKSRDISIIWIADDETNYLYVLFTANGDAVSFSSASGEFSPINHHRPTRCIFQGGSQRFVVKFYFASPVSNNFYSQTMGFSRQILLRRVANMAFQRLLLTPFASIPRRKFNFPSA